jgi:hypothetical protein
MKWHGRFEGEFPNETQARDTLDLTTLWHATFMNLLVDFDKLERALGRDGLQSESLDSDIVDAVSWSTSLVADRCVLHAYAIHDRLCQMRLSADPAIHVPHCAFMAGIIAYSCLRFRKPAMLTRYPPGHHTSLRSPADFPEFNMKRELDRNPLFENTPVLFENERGELFMRTFAPQRPIMMVGAELFRRCTEVLQRMGHFEIARSYTKTLKALAYVEVEKWMRDD